MTWGPLPPSKLDVPIRRETFIDITVSGSATIGGTIRGGDIISTNWDGADPLNLSSYDTDATAGYAMDGSEGASQWMGDVFVGGDIVIGDIAGRFTKLAGGTGLQTWGDLLGDEYDPDDPAALIQAVAFDSETDRTGTTLLYGFGWDGEERPWMVARSYNHSFVEPHWQFGFGALSEDILTINTQGVYIDGDLSGLPWKPWTPSYSNLTKGNGTVTARYVRIGDTVFAYFRLVFGSTTSIDGSDPTISKPVAALAAYGSNVPFGLARLLDAGSADYTGSVRQIIDTNFNVQVDKVDGTYSVATAISATVPFTWTTNDKLVFFVTYEAA